MENNGVGRLECILDMVSFSILIDCIFYCLKRKVLLVIPTEHTYVHNHKSIPTSIIHMKPCTFVEMGQYSG